MRSSGRSRGSVPERKKFTMLNLIAAQPSQGSRTPPLLDLVTGQQCITCRASPTPIGSHRRPRKRSIARAAASVTETKTGEIVEENPARLRQLCSQLLLLG